MRNDAKHFGDALTWIERNHPGGIALVARALSETSPWISHVSPVSRAPSPPETPAEVQSDSPGGEGDVDRGRPRDRAVNDAGPATGAPTAGGSPSAPETPAPEGAAGTRPGWEERDAREEVSRYAKMMAAPASPASAPRETTCPCFGAALSNPCPVCGRAPSPTSTDPEELLP